MISAQFRIQLPESLWVTTLSRQYPQATFRLLSGNRLTDHAIELGETITDSPDEILEAVRSHASISNYELLLSEDRRILGKYETSDTALYDFAETSSLAIEFPVAVQNGWYEFSLTGTREEFDRLQEILDASPLSYELQSVIRERNTDQLLTDRQQEVLKTAIRNGYFEVPRGCTVAELAATLDVDTSTVSTVLRRGESRIVKWFMTEASTPNSQQ